MTRSSWISTFFCLSLLLTTIAPLAAQSRAQSTPARVNANVTDSPLARAITLELRDVTLDRALREIDRQAGLGLSYTPRVVPVERRVTLVASGIAAGEALRRVLSGTRVVAEVTQAGTVMLVQAPAPVSPRDTGRADSVAIVAGQVTSEADQAPLAGAIVTVSTPDGRTVHGRAVTSGNGVFMVQGVPVGERRVRVRHIGYQPQDQEVAVSGEVVRVNFALRMSQSQLQEMVVTATGEQRRIELGNDITVIDVAKVMEERPVASMADLLEARVPGLTVQRTSGAPGDPSRIRIRGQGSVYRNNDPIVIVDGIRIYSEQSAERSGNLANGGRSMGPAGGYAAPSPLDDIDLNNIDKIEIFKGPSAATLYGADAANGVIVITSKRGRSGPPTWNVSVEHGQTRMPGRFPEGMVRWGHDPMHPDALLFCGALNPGCVTDSLVTFQALNDPELTFLDRGERSSVQLGVSGGSRGFSYRLNGSYSDEVGMARLPQAEVARFKQRAGQAPPGWMQRPQQHKQWALSSVVGTDVGERANISLSTSLTVAEQHRSSLENQISALMATYVDRASGRYYQARSFSNANITDASRILTKFMERATDDRTSFFTSLSGTWRARDWLTTNMDAGIQLTDRINEVLLMRGMGDIEDVGIAADTLGRVSVARGRVATSTLNAGATMQHGLPLGWRLQLSMGANYVNSSTADVGMAGHDLPAGSSSIAKTAEIVSLTDRAEEVTSFGVFVAPTISFKSRLFISGAVRLDGGSTYGDNVSLVAFPKASVSYVLSEEPFFPFKDQIGELRLRAAYGQAGVQPGPSDRLRLYSDARAWENGGYWPGAMLQTLGNTELRPERSEEFEAGFDASILDDRLTMSFSGYRKTQVDALMEMPLPPSVYGTRVSILRNVGVIRNTGREMSLGAEVLRHDVLSWRLALNVAQSRNKVVELGPGIEPFNTSEEVRVEAGYPLGGRWVKPILGYSDRNGDGAISSNELLVGDSLVYVGASTPDYTAGLQSSISLFRRTLTVTASLDYQHDLTQEGGGRLGMFSPAYADPDAPLHAQAAILAQIYGGTGRQRTSYWNYQTVSTLRFSSLSVTWAAPRRLAERMGARSLSVALQGSNLGLRTGYRGLDPHVNGYSTGNRVADTGVIPQPRRWGLRVSAQY